MAKFTMTFEVAGETATVSRNFTNARALRFLDDLIEHFPDIDDGNNGKRPMDRAEIATLYVTKLLEGQVQWSKGLEQNRLNANVVAATDLEDN